MMKHLTIAGAKNTSDIYIASGLAAQTAANCMKKFSPSKVHIVTDSHVYPLLFESIRSQFSIPVSKTILPAGEAHKNLDAVSAIYHDLCAAGLTRKDLVIALGGGVTGDIAGFAASSFLRGVSLCQIPTTLLAQVDSSVGGKCGVDLPEGKNLVGAFYQPSLVLIDPSVLSTLPDTIFSDGMAEVIKYGCIQNSQILALAEKETFRQHIDDILYECVKIKRDIVSKDEFDTGLRMILNFGHTIGHAAERLGNYTELTHGQAVAIGMVAAVKIGQALGVGPDVSHQLCSILQQHHLPTELPYPIDDIFCALQSDKKKMADTIHFILLKELGKSTIYPIKTDALLAVMRKALSQRQEKRI